MTFALPGVDAVFTTEFAELRSPPAGRAFAEARGVMEYRGDLRLFSQAINPLLSSDIALA